jgi:hypothetical protein
MPKRKFRKCLMDRRYKCDVRTCIFDCDIKDKINKLKETNNVNK